VTLADAQAPAGAAARTFEVDARRTDPGVSFVHAADRRIVDAAVTPRPGGDVLVQLPHVDIPTVLDGRRGRRAAAGAAGGQGEQRLTAPMPGRIVRVLVTVGDEVAARQGLVVIEAMKMENELTSARAGRVHEIAVSEGTSVDAGRLLIVVR
jgi:biotin carboxyl carrier protein